jgi:acetyl esterase/lipase
MPLDPEMKSLLDAMAKAKLPAFHTLTPIAARKQMATQFGQGAAEPIVEVEDREIPGPGGPVPVRIYKPSSSARLGVLVYFHGGGWVLGNSAMTDQPCRMLANQAGCAVISVEYRLAPEHKFPAAPDDCFAVTKWTAEHGASLGLDPRRIAVGGTSAGGTLAAVVALMARDRGGPPLAFQLLIYPATTSELTSPSQREFADDGYILSRADMEWFWGHYLNGDIDRTNPYACPDFADNLAGLPPALVITAEYDPLRDEGEAYAARLRAGGAPVVLTRYEGVTHGFFGMPSLLKKSRLAIADAAAALRAEIG